MSVIYPSSCCRLGFSVNNVNNTTAGRNAGAVSTCSAVLALIPRCYVSVQIQMWTHVSQVNTLMCVTNTQLQKI